MAGSQCLVCGFAIAEDVDYCHRCLVGLGLRDSHPNSGPVDREGLENPAFDELDSGGKGEEDPVHGTREGTTLKVGMSFGAYEIIAPIAAGGMGEVYLAEDARLGRKVALKIVREPFARRKDHLMRFEREARLLASLSHPNIGSLYGLEESAGVRALVLEFVEGLALHERIRGRPLLPREAARIARQIAEALESAHARGILHRDLKPSNIKITPNGVVKVLDFGLAKILEPESSTEEAGRLPTITTATQEGTLIGTAPYMSPEQVRGEPLDFRSDIWAFGCVLYEMVAAKPAFSGRTATDIGAAILERDPDWSLLPEGSSAGLGRLMRRCLRKDRHRRLQHIGDARGELEEILESGDERAGTVDRRQGRRSFRLALGWLAVGVLLGSVVGLMVTWPPEPPPGRRGEGVGGSVRFIAELPEGLIVPAGLTRQLTVSPDGSHLVFAAHDRHGLRLYLRSMREAEVRPIAGTEGAVAPFFSPDGQWIGFFSRGELRKVSISGGEPMSMGRVPGPVYLAGSWGPDGKIVSGSFSQPLFRLSAAGGKSERITRLKEEAGETSHHDPEILPGGGTVLFTVDTGNVITRIEALDLKSGSRRVVIDEGSNPRYVDEGYLVYNRGETLMTVPFDAESARVTGPHVPMLGGVAVYAPGKVAHFSLSRSGSLAYIAAGDAVPRRALLKVDRKGRRSPLPADERGYTTTNLTPDGSWLAVATLELDASWISISPVDRLALARLRIPGHVLTPCWHPGGRLIAFAGTGEGQWDLFTASIEGGSPAVRLTNTPAVELPTSWSADGRYLVFQEWNPSSRWMLKLLQWRGDGVLLEPETLVANDGSGGTLSPDGRWLAYARGGLGRMEILVQELSDGGRPRQVSTRGGAYPAWSPRGDELFYVRGHPFEGRSRSNPPYMAQAVQEPEFIAVETLAGSNLKFGEEQVLFNGEFHFGEHGVRYYAVAPDAESFVIPGPDRGTAPTRIHVIVNWAEELAERVPLPR